MKEQYFIGLALRDDHSWQTLRRDLLRKLGKPYTVGLHITIVQPFTTDDLNRCESIIGDVVKEFAAVNCAERLYSGRG